jgi:hypothetical protein
MPSTVGIVASAVTVQVALVGEDSDVTAGGFRVVTWLSSGSISVDGGVLPVEYLVVAGGGGGGGASVDYAQGGEGALTALGASGGRGGGNTATVTTVHGLGG